MNVNTPNPRRIFAFIPALLILGNANASNTEIDVVRRHYLVAADVSSMIDLTPYESPSQSPAIYQLTGSFDVDYAYIDKPGEPRAGADWIGFANSTVTSAISNLVLPSFLFKLNNEAAFSSYPFTCGELASSLDTCTKKIYPTLPLDPAYQNLSGQLSNGRISLDYEWKDGNTHYAYHIEAAPVPVPGAFSLFISALGMFTMARAKASRSNVQGFSPRLG